jgi:mediator of RNA polymerase II transcription subunit 7
MAMIQEQLDQKRAETAAIRSVVDKAKRALEGLGSIDVPDLMPNSVDVGKDGRRKIDGMASQHHVHKVHWERETLCWAGVETEFP